MIKNNSKNQRKCRWDWGIEANLKSNWTILILTHYSVYASYTGVDDLKICRTALVTLAYQNAAMNRDKAPDSSSTAAVATQGGRSGDGGKYSEKVWRYTRWWLPSCLVVLFFCHIFNRSPCWNAFVSTRACGFFVPLYQITLVSCSNSHHSFSPPPRKGGFWGVDGGVRFAEPHREGPEGYRGTKRQSVRLPGSLVWIEMVL